MKYILVILALFLAEISIAENHYFCTINAVSGLSASGDISVEYTKPYKGQSFSVSKVTGLMQGFLQNDLGGTPEIIQQAGKDYSFKVFTKSITKHTDGYYLQIQDFEHALSKPFMYIQSGYIYHGLCE